MSQQSRRILLGVLLVVSGAAFLLQQLLTVYRFPVRAGGLCFSVFPAA